MDNESAFVNCMDNFISDSVAREKAGSAAGDFVHNNAGATERILSFFPS